ncbi:MAG TPA: SMC family ATPase [Anaerolineaceae bacterium]|nr:SMC family ATPase [Anaerolineaceae bacterium]
MIPIKLSLSGFTSYREPVEIDFTGLDLVCISGQNGSGKSSLLDAITYALYGQARRRDEAIIHHASQKAEVSLEFAYEHQVYRVSRSITRGKGSQVEFYIRAENGPTPWKVLTERTMSETNARIQHTLRLDYETFINASFFLQGKADLFATQKPADRKRILSNILGLDSWEEYRKRAADLIQKRKGEVLLRDERLKEIQNELDEEPARHAKLQLLEEKLKNARTETLLEQSALEQKRAVEQRLVSHRQMLALHEAQERKAAAARTETARRLNEKEAALAALQQKLASAESVEAAYKHLESLRKQLGELDALSERFHPLENRKRDLESRIALERQKLLTEVKHLEEEEQQLEREEAANAARKAQQEQLHAQIAALEERASRKETLEQEAEMLQKRLAELQAENAEIEKKGKELRDRLEKVQKVEGAECPLCGQPLALHDRERLEQELNEELLTQREQYRLNQEEIKSAAQRQREITEERAQIQSFEKQIQSLTRQADQLGQQISLLAARAEEFANTKALQLEHVRAALAEESYCAQERAERTEVLEKITALAYDPEAHARLREEARQAEPARAAYNELQIARSTVGQQEQSLLELQETLEKQEEDLQRAAQERSKAAADLAEIESSLPDIQVTEQSFQAKQDAEAGLQRQVGAARQELHILTELKARKISLREEKEQLNAEIARLKVLERAFSKDGVPAMLIEQALPELEEEANRVLGRLSNYSMSVRFNPQREFKDVRRADKMETLDITISDGSSTRDYETYSGGEAFRINFAIRLALARLLSRRSGAQLRTLVIDEGFGNQDADGRQRLVEAIGRVADDFDMIMVITHIEELKEQFPNRIEVEKGPSGSRVSVIRG